MEFKFNSYDIITPPKIALCRIDTQMIGYLQFTNLVIKPTFCSLSEVTFKCYKDTNLYDCIRKHMTLVIDGFGRFVIDSFSETDDGQNKYKEITAYSYESTMNNVTLTYKEDTVFKLFDVIEPEKTLLGIIQSQTGWIVKEIDSSLLNKIRTMSIDNEQAYGLLVGDIAETFKCYFVFDTMNKYIYCYDRDEVERPIKNSGINLSFRNLINEVKGQEVYTYGAKVAAIKVWRRLLSANIRVKSFLVSEKFENPDKLKGLDVIRIEKVHRKLSYVVAAMQNNGGGMEIGR